MYLQSALLIMITIKDFEEKIILYVDCLENSGSKIRINNENVAIERDEQIINQVSCHRVLAVFIIGDCSLTTVFLKQASKFGISVFLMKRNFETFAPILNGVEGHYLLRMKQYDGKDDFLMSKEIVKNKVANQISLIMENKIVPKEISSDKNYKDNILKKIDEIKEEKELLGIEGSNSKMFFNSYFEELNWRKRLPRIKLDPYNLLLDMGYTFLFNYIESILKLFGFDTYKGFYHKLFFKRKSLACDIMEPFRCIIEKQLLKSFHLKQISEDDFEVNNGRYVLKYDKSKKYAEIFIRAILERKEDVFIFINAFYRYAMSDDKDRKFPVFKI